LRIAAPGRELVKMGEVVKPGGMIGAGGYKNMVNREGFLPVFGKEL
jgi:hypothetical protein